MIIIYFQQYYIIQFSIFEYNLQFCSTHNKKGNNEGAVLITKQIKKYIKINSNLSISNKKTK